MIMKRLFTALIVFFLSCNSGSKQQQMMNQYPSPMTDNIRAHERIEKQKLPGIKIVLKDVLPKPVDIYVSDQHRDASNLALLIHFHGASYIPEYAVYQSKHLFMLATVNLGSGSSRYEKPFSHDSTFLQLVQVICDSVSEQMSRKIKPSRIYLSSFSAGYGAVRAILKHHAAKIDGIILLDGLHTDYVPARRVLAQGGSLNEAKLQGFSDFARLALENKKRFLITHSAIFPGTYASTTETADYLIRKLGLQRNPVLKWGPGGMQLVSETQTNGLTILGFAGNTAPDHVDHLHGLPEFLKMFLKNY